MSDIITLCLMIANSLYFISGVKISEERCCWKKYFAAAAGGFFVLLIFCNKNVKKTGASQVFRSCYDYDLFMMRFIQLTIATTI